MHTVKKFNRRTHYKTLITGFSVLFLSFFGFSGQTVQNGCIGYYSGSFSISEKSTLISKFENEQKSQNEIHYLKEVERVWQKLYLISASFLILCIIGIYSRLRYIRRSKIELQKEKDRSENLLLNVLPAEIAEELKANGHAKPKQYDLVTVMFTDFKDFSRLSKYLSAEQLVKELSYCYSEFDIIISKFGIEKIKSIGDSYLCAGGLPILNDTHPEDVVKAALELQQFMAQYNQEKIAKGELTFEMRIGIHTGPVVAGIIGIKKFAYDIWGDAVNTASRMEQGSEVGKVNISGVTYEFVKDKFNCLYRGKIELKNKDEMDMYFVEGVLKY